MKNTQLYPTDLTDSQWDCIKELIPPAKPGGHPRTLDMRAIINTLLYLTVTGCQWRMLPRDRACELLLAPFGKAQQGESVLRTRGEMTARGSNERRAKAMDEGDG